MKITVLGCWGAYPEAGEATSGYLLQTDKHKILLDCGSGVLANLFRHVSLEQLDAVFISHFHHDHCADIGCLLYASKIAMGLGKRVQPLSIYANSQSERFKDLNFGEYTIGKEIKPETVVESDGLRVSFAKTVHEEVNLAMKFEYGGKVLVYTGDLGPDTDLINFASGADLLICETSLFEQEAGLFLGHMTTKETAEMAQRAEVKNLLITHFPHTGEVRKMPEEISKYFNGLIWMAEGNKSFVV